jgi:hypothetical protein
METKLKSFLTFALFLILFTHDVFAWVGTRMRKSSVAPVPLSFSDNAISTIRPGQKWQFAVIGGVSPYTFDIQSGTGTISSSGVYTAPSTLNGSSVIRATDGAGTQLNMSVSNALSTITMTSATYQIVSDPQMIVVDSGGTGGNYGINEHSGVLVRGDAINSNIITTFGSFQTESGYDKFFIYNGNATSAPLLGTFSGASLPSTTTANLGSSLFIFSSDSNTQFAGYQAHWSILPTSLSMVHKNLFALDSGADETFIATSGVGPYTFSIVSGSGTITPSNLDPAAGIFHASSSAGSVTIRVTDSAGSTYDETVTVANAYNMGTTTSSTLSNGIVYDQGGPNGNYPNANNGFVITPSTPNSGIQLKIDHVVMENGYDFVRVYDGTNASGTLLATFTGYLSGNSTVTATSGSMYIQLSQDGNIFYNGFRGVWKALP